jgi:hypothetical protein
MGANGGSSRFLRQQATGRPATEVTFGPQRGADGR